MHVTIHSLYTVYWNPRPHISPACAHSLRSSSLICVILQLAPRVKKKKKYYKKNQPKLLPWRRRCLWSGDSFYECLTELPNDGRLSVSVHVSALITATETTIHYLRVTLRGVRPHFETDTGILEILVHFRTRRGCALVRLGNLGLQIILWFISVNLYIIYLFNFLSFGP